MFEWCGASAAKQGESGRARWGGGVEGGGHERRGQRGAYSDVLACDCGGGGAVAVVGVRGDADTGAYSEAGTWSSDRVGVGGYVVVDTFRRGADWGAGALVAAVPGGGCA